MKTPCTRQDRGKASGSENRLNTDERARKTQFDKVYIEQPVYNAGAGCLGEGAVYGRGRKEKLETISRRRVGRGVI